MNKLKKATFKHIESELYSYHDTLKEIEFLRKNIMFVRESADENTGGSRSLTISKPTEEIATRLATHKRLNQLEEVADAIQVIYANLTDEHKNLVKLKYWKRPQLLTWDGIAEELHVNRTTAMRWRDAIVLAVAQELGWR